METGRVGRLFRVIGAAVRVRDGGFPGGGTAVGNGKVEITVAANI